jgi:sodium transport system permease protein
MVNTIWTIFKKEWLAMFRDKRGFFINLIISGLLLPVIATLPSILMLTSTVDGAASKIKLAVGGLENAPSFVEFVKTSKYAKSIELVDVPDVEKAVQSQDFSVGVIFPANFEKLLTDYKPIKVELLSAAGLKVVELGTVRIDTLLESYSEQLIKKRLEEKGVSVAALETFETSTREITMENVRFQRSSGGWVLYLIVSIWAASMLMTKSVDVSTAEKEKLTIEALLLAPVHRLGIILGKFFFVLSFGISFTILNTISGLAIFSIWMVAVAPKLKSLQDLSTAETSQATGAGLSALPSPTSILLLGFMVMFIVFMFISLQMLIGFWARSETQANTILGLVILLPMSVSFIYFLDNYTPATWHYAVPLLGQALTFSDLLSNHLEPAPLALSFGSALVCCAISILSSTWLLQREDVILRT